MKKIVIISILFGIHFSICMAQIACKTVFDKDCSSLKMTIVNLYEDIPVLLKSDNAQAKEIEILQSFSDERIRTYVDRNKLLDITLCFYDKNNKEQKNVNIRISDKKLLENEIAPLDSVSFTFYCFDREETTHIHKIEVRISVPYSTVDKKTLEGRYDCFDYIYLPFLVE